MLRVLVALLVLTQLASAEDQVPKQPWNPMKVIRELYEKGDYEGVRRELLEAYQIEPRPQFLFALGQVELQLGNYQAAIDYYDKFIATGPSDEQAALAQQAIGAARLKLAETPKPPPEPIVIVKERDPDPAPVPPSGKRWTLTHTGLAAFGGASLLLSGGLLLYARSLGNDRSGTLSQYDSRVGQARSARWTALGLGTVGTLLVGVTVVW